MNYTAVIPSTEKDDDQVLYQMGFESSIVSKIELHVNNKHIAFYGLRVCGEQTVSCFYDEEDNEKLVEVGEGDEYKIIKEPETLWY